MCTLTWHIRSESYELHFNRDESRQRPIALAPSIHTQGATRFIAPIDPQAGGTWIATNEHGLSLCLLNHYAASLLYRGDTSRGQLVLTLATSRSIDEVKQTLAATDLHRFSPFDIVVFQIGKVAVHIRWDGVLKHTSEPKMAFMTSSGYDTENVISTRRKAFEHFEGDDLAAFHRSHLPKKSAYSVCMHREDARTQSYSHIRVNALSSAFTYVDGPPCQNIPSQTSSITNTTQAHL